jgi:hypothetical protein
MHISKTILSVVAARTSRITVTRVVVLLRGFVLLRFLNSAFWGYDRKTKACRVTATYQRPGVL